MSRFTSPDFLRQAGEKHTRTQPPPSIDLTHPSIARLYSFYLGGKDHFQVDRDMAARAENVAPGVADLALGNRAFVQRAVRYLSREQGIGQFLDMGVGLPVDGPVHEVAHENAPDARVVYVTDDPVVLAHTRALLCDGTTTTAVDASLREPAKVIGNAETRKFIDFDQPVGLLMGGTVQHLADDTEPGRLIAELRDALAPGSFLVLSHYCRPSPARFPKDALRAEQLERLFHEEVGAGRWRDFEEIEAYFDGWDLDPPGLIPLQWWRTMPVAPRLPGCYQMPKRNRQLVLGGVAAKP